MSCTPHTADCSSDQPHPSRAHSAGTLPSQAADVRGDLQRHAADWRGPKGGVGMVVAVWWWVGVLAEYRSATFWSCFLHDVCRVLCCQVEITNFTHVIQARSDEACANTKRFTNVTAQEKGEIPFSSAFRYHMNHETSENKKKRALIQMTYPY